MAKTIRVGIMGVLLLTAACSGILGSSLGQVGELAMVEGEVLSMDVTPMAADGPARIELLSPEHGRVLVLVQACFGGCSLQAVQALQVMAPGQTWRATGEVGNEGNLLLYSEGEHRLERLDLP